MSFKGDYILDLDAWAHKSLGLFLYKKIQRENLWHAYNEPINIYSEEEGDESREGKKN